MSLNYVQCAMNMFQLYDQLRFEIYWYYLNQKTQDLLKNVEKSLYYLLCSHIPAMFWFYWFQEDLVEIEFVERQPAPKPEDSLLHDDWVSCLQGCKEWSVLCSVWDVCVWSAGMGGRDRFFSTAWCCWVSCLQSCKEWSVLGRVWCVCGSEGAGGGGGWFLSTAWRLGHLFIGLALFILGRELMRVWVMFNLWMNTGSADFL